MSTDKRLERVKEKVAAIPDFPKKGILFRDLFPVLTFPDVFKGLISLMSEYVKDAHPDCEGIIGLESRGFLYGPMIAQELNVSFVPVRKKGKLPGELVQVTYQLEYGTDTFEMQKNSLKPGQKVVIVDDLLATGGTMAAAVELVQQVGGIAQCGLVVIELVDLKGREKIQGTVKSFLQYSGD
ncbi:adenine phosphoribosyltransferase-like isoform X1 [Lingula anatina]|uniref:Adenine phosphoribosyltransferase n=1 Tax=Lingula anatina TaxID=7574 RepID=A0A1S3HNH3_LINAN|nr:adenine phosphoribosyltransferase-like isoform X1 [Lingula anatina]|eukprot:XP_013387076.1 adenine phosphoribosyltransferase-like isoform X1 [Lingula anatina]